MCMSSPIFAKDISTISEEIPFYKMVSLVLYPVLNHFSQFAYVVDDS